MASSTPPPNIPFPVTTPGPDIEIKIVPPAFTFPDWWNAARDLLNGISDSASKRQLTVTGEGGIIPVTVGRDRVGPGFTDVIVYNGKLVIMAVWGEGPYQEIEEVNLGSSPFTGTIRHYLGANVEATDATLAVARSLYTSNPTDICFSVLEVSTTDTFDSLSVTARLKGRNDIWDPRLSAGAGANAYTSNAALVLGWYIKEVLGETVNQTDLETCADFADETLGTLSGDEVADRGLYRHRIGLTFTRGQNKLRALQALQEYAQVFIAREGDTVRMFPSKDAAAVGSVTPSDVVAGTFDKSISGLSRVPNMITVIYTDINGTEWKDVPYSTPVPGGGVPIREQRVAMGGIQSLAQATRFGITRLNKYTLARQKGSYGMRDDGLKHLAGEIIDLTDVEGASVKPVRLTSALGRGKGNWQFKWVEHDALINSDVVVSEPSVTDTSLPSPNNVPNVTGLVLSVNVPQFQTGIYLSSINATWNELTDYQFERTFEVVFRQGGSIVGSVPTSELEANFGPLEEGLTYDVEVRAVGVFGARSVDATNGVITVDGKDFPPSDVPSFLALGIAGEIRMSWGKSVDNQAIWRYEIRYGAASVTWANATFLTRTDSLAHTTTDVPPGTWDLLIKAIDNTDNESSNAAVSGGVVVDDDADAFILDTASADHASNSNMTQVKPEDYWVTDSGETWNSLFPNAMSTYTSALYSYQSLSSSSWTSEELNPAIGDVGGTWQSQIDVEDVSGAATPELELFNGTIWSAQGQLSIVATAQKARTKVSGSTDEIFIVRPPAEMRLHVITRKIKGFGLTDASSPYYDEISISPAMKAIQSVTALPKNTTNMRSITYDIDSTGDIDWIRFYGFDESNARAAVDFSYVIEGI